MFLFKNLGTWQILCIERFRRNFFKMLGNISGDVGNFGLPRKVIKLEFVSFLPKTFGRPRKIMMLKTFWHFEDFMLPNNYGTS